MAPKEKRWLILLFFFINESKNHSQSDGCSFLFENTSKNAKEEKYDEIKNNAQNYHLQEKIILKNLKWIFFKIKFAEEFMVRFYLKSLNNSFFK